MSTEIEQAREKKHRRIDAGENIKVNHNWIFRANKNPSSLKKAIGAMCFQCVGGTAESLPDPGWKDMIRNCTSKDCALLPHRPYKGKATDNENDCESDQD